jgi:phage/plasmid primase-like uncharacterized protein
VPYNNNNIYLQKKQDENTPTATFSCKKLEKIPSDLNNNSEQKTYPAFPKQPKPFKIDFTSQDYRSLVLSVLPDLPMSSSEWVRIVAPFGEKHPNKNNKDFAINPSTGAWINHYSGDDKGNVWLLVRAIKGSDDIIRDYLKAHYNIDTEAKYNEARKQINIQEYKRESESKQKKNANRIKYAQKDYNNSQNFNENNLGSLTKNALDYFNNRAINLDVKTLNNLDIKTQQNDFYVSQEGIKTGIDKLLFPMRNIKNEITGLQQVFIKDGCKCPVINPNVKGDQSAAKRMKGVVKDSFWVLDSINNSKKTIIVEGPETALGLYYIYDQKVNIIVSMSANNMTNAYSMILSKYTNQQIIVAVDNDKSETGQKTARKLCSLIPDLKMALPDKIKEKSTDWLDVIEAFGKDKALNLFESKIADEKNNDLNKIRKAVAKSVNEAVVGTGNYLIIADPGAGKTYNCADAFIKIYRKKNAIFYFIAL